MQLYYTRTQLNRNGVFISPLIERHSSFNDKIAIDINSINLHVFEMMNIVGKHFEKNFTTQSKTLI